MNTAKIGIRRKVVQKSLFLPLIARAIESKKEKPRLFDSLAIDIMERTDYDFTSLISATSELSQMAWIIRSICFDRLIRDFIRRFPHATIINIGCGLSTTYERVNNGSITWYDLDLPEVIELKKFFMTETENRKFISVSFLESTWFRQLLLTENILFVAEGVYYLFEEKTIKKFLINLSYSFPHCEMVFDVTSPCGVRITNHILRKAGITNESLLQWGLKNVSTILSWNSRFRLLGKYYTYKQKGISMSFKNRLLGIIIDFLDIQYIVHIRLIPDYKHIT
jgi:O-methyltransferase involved in polyketide biosynthesis